VQTVDKALKLLIYFTPSDPEIGLSDLARLSGYDKAATRRFLVALQKHAFIEQNPDNRKYRLGAAFLHFAQVREATRPLSSIVMPLLEGLTAETGETSHASHYSASALINIGISESPRATRVHMDPSEILPLHATGSGLVYLAYGPEGTLDDVISAGLEKYTPHTITSAKALRDAVRNARQNGYALSPQSFEDEVSGIAMPYFDGSGTALGALAVAAPTSRMTDELKDRIIDRLAQAVHTVTKGIGGKPHPDFLSAQKGKQAA